MVDMLKKPAESGHNTRLNLHYEKEEEAVGAGSGAGS